MGGIEKKKIWTGLPYRPSVYPSHCLGTSYRSHPHGAPGHLLGLREFYNLALPQSKRIERFMGIGLGLILSIIDLLWGCKNPSLLSLSFSSFFSLSSYGHLAEPFFHHFQYGDHALRNFLYRISSLLYHPRFGTWQMERSGSFS